MKVVVVTGLSGAGKTQAIDCLEDMGYYCIDNIPPALIKNFIDLTSSGKGMDKAAFVVDVRGREFFSSMEDIIAELKKDEIEYKIIYLEASDRTLIRRYNETRRTHPLSEGGSVSKGIKREREMLTETRAMADFIIDTSKMKTAQLWSELKDLLTSDENQNTFMVNLVTFGYKRGVPIGADVVFDMRFIPNPYHVPSLRKLTGNNKKVSHYVLKQKVTQDFIKSILHMIEFLTPHYMREGKYSLNIGIGCTGGHHRSVAVANEINRLLKEKGVRTTLEHRDL